MLGRKDGLNFLDISAEDFWASFYAIAVALPPLFASWVAYAANLTAGREEAGTRFLIVTRTAVVDIGAWLVPLVIIGLLAKRIGIAKRYATYVIAINWGNALLAWLFTPITLLQLFFSRPLRRGHALCLRHVRHIHRAELPADICCAATPPHLCSTVLRLRVHWLAVPDGLVAAIARDQFRSACLLGHVFRAHPEKCETVFGKDARQNKGLERVIFPCRGFPLILRSR
ncbi:conserved hypothetical protein [Brucella abortus NCTC 8038]|nr:conserved hypothetical protein [Brucella abortus NCTC 8038]KFH24454.1 hypothetical protein IB63_02835 [Brucella abortus 544]KFH24894.1 hypothetical protein IB61_10630 [Brucella abortus LMN2]